MKHFHVKFSAKNLTGNAGLVHFGRFADKLGLPKILKQVISIKRGPNADHNIANTVMMLMMGVLSGAKHISDMIILRNDPVIRKLFNWDKFPDKRTFGRLFKLFTHKHCNELHKAENIAREKVWSKKWFGRVTLDIDSTVIGVNGSQQGAAKGFNPKKKVKKVITRYYVLSRKPENAFIVGTVQDLPIQVMELLSLSENVFHVFPNEFGKCSCVRIADSLMAIYLTFWRKKIANI